MFQLIAQWAEDRNLIEGSTPQAQFLKLTEELGEVAECIAKDLPLEDIKKEFGDMLVVLTILAAQYNLSIEECAHAAYEKIKNRTGRMHQGVFIREATPCPHCRGDGWEPGHVYDVDYACSVCSGTGEV